LQRRGEATAHRRAWRTRRQAAEDADRLVVVRPGDGVVVLVRGDLCDRLQRLGALVVGGRDLPGLLGRRPRPDQVAEVAGQPGPFDIGAELAGVERRGPVV